MFEVDIVYLRNLETGSAPAALRTGNTRHCWACMSLKILIKLQTPAHLSFGEVTRIGRFDQRM